jgi:hypothetical protein
MYRNGIVKLVIYNQVLDGNGRLDDGNSQLFDIVVANGEFRRTVHLRHGESAELSVPKGAYAIATDESALNGEYKYVALITPEGLAGAGSIVDLADADEANVTVLNKKAEAAAAVGGNVIVIKYVIDNGLLLAEDLANTFRINVDGNQIVAAEDSEPLSDTANEETKAAENTEPADNGAGKNLEGEAGNIGSAGDNGDDGAGNAATIGNTENTGNAENTGNTEGNGDSADYGSAGPAGSDESAKAHGAAVAGEIAGSMPQEAGAAENEGGETTPNYIAIVAGNESANTATVGDEAYAAGSGNAAAGPDEAAGGAAPARDAAMSPLAEVERPFSAKADVAQGRRHAFNTGKGTFTVTESLAGDSGYELEGIFELGAFGESIGAGADSLNVAVGDDAGAVAVVFNKAVAVTEPGDAGEPNLPLDEDDGKDTDPAPAPNAPDSSGSLDAGGAAQILPNLALEEFDDGKNPLAAFTSKHIQYIFGDPTGMVRPDSVITRAETAIIIYRLLADGNKDMAAPAAFSDVDDGQWYSQAVNYLAYIGAVNGYPDGSFKPNAPISRAEFTKLIAGFDNLEQAGGDMFSDIGGNWAAKYINSAAAKGWVSGYPDGTFSPDSNITRAETVSLMNAKLQRGVNPENIPDWAPSYTDLGKGHWAYSDIIEASISHAYEYDENGAEIWDVPSAAGEQG